VARIRTIKPDFFRHVGLYEAEIETELPLRVAFAGLWTSADREGRFIWEPRTLKLDALPYDEVDFSRVLDALLTRGFVVRYEINGKVYGCIPSWDKHQSINNKELASVLPEMTPESILEPLSTREARVNDASITPLFPDQGEGKGREGNMHASMTRAFENFWEAYPKKKSKGDAEKAWKTLKPNEHLADTILQAVQRAKTSREWAESGGKFIPYPASWLRDKGWLDGDAPSAKPVWEQ